MDDLTLATNVYGWAAGLYIILGINKLSAKVFAHSHREGIKCGWSGCQAEE